MTQNDILANEKSIENIVKVFENSNIGCAYGRQFSHKEASLFSILLDGLITKIKVISIL